MSESEKQTTAKTIADRIRRGLSVPGRRDFHTENAPRHRGLVITFCVLAAGFLWFTFSMRETYTQVFEFSTEVQNLPPHLALTSVPPSTVRVQVEGEGIRLLRLYYNPPTIPLDASISEIDLALLTPEIMSNVRTVPVTPGVIILETDTRVEKRIPIEPRTDLQKEPGFHEVGDVRVQPDSVTVSGAASILRELDGWPTQILSLSAVKDTVRQTVLLADTLAGLVDLSVTQTVLSVDVPEFTEGDRVIEIQVLDAPAGEQITFDPATTVVTYQVPAVQFDRAFDATDFYAFVRYEDIAADTTGQVYLTVNAPGDITLREVRVFPDAVRYYFFF